MDSRKYRLLEPPLYSVVYAVARRISPDHGHNNRWTLQGQCDALEDSLKLAIVDIRSVLICPSVEVVNGLAQERLLGS